MKSEDDMTAAELIEYWLKKEQGIKGFADDKVVRALFIDSLYILELADEADRLYINCFP